MARSQRYILIVQLQFANKANNHHFGGRIIVLNNLNFCESRLGSGMQ